MTAAPPDQDAPREAPPPSLEALARRFLDLWQSHVAALAGDPETNRLLGRLVETQIETAEALLKASQAVTWPIVHDPASTPNPAGAEAAAAPPPDRERNLAEFTRRLAACEERLAQLEKRS